MASENGDMINEDWANLNYYKEENLKLARKRTKESIIFMGDSITEEWGRIMPEFFSNKQYINRGIGGQTTPQMLIRFRQDVIDLNPKAVIILAGTNDIAGNTGPSSVKMIIDNLMQILSYLQELTFLKISLYLNQLQLTLLFLTLSKKEFRHLHDYLLLLLHYSKPLLIHCIL